MVLIDDHLARWAPAVQTADEIRERLRTAEPELRAFGVRRLALFGSFVRGEAGPTSDIDLLAEWEPERETLRSFMAAADLLEERLGRRVDFVSIHSLSPYIGPHILAEAEDVVRAP